LTDFAGAFGRRKFDILAGACAVGPRHALLIFSAFGISENGADIRRHDLNYEQRHHSRRNLSSVSSLAINAQGRRLAPRH